MERIRELRNEKGLSQAKLAVMADMDPATLNRLERGAGNPNLKTLERVADALGVEVADFFPKAQAPLPEMQEHGALLEKRGWPSEQIAARLAEDEREREFIARELEKMSPKDLREALIATNPRLRKYYREHPPRTDASPRSESA